MGRRLGDPQDHLSKSMKKIILFDLDGTIADVQPIERLVLKKILEEKNVIYTGNLNFGFNDKNFVKEYQRCFGILKENSLLPSPKLLLDVRKFKFEASCSLGLVTGGVKIETEWVLKRLGIKDVFRPELLFCREDYTGSKKDGGPYVKIKRLFPDSLVVVLGDSVADLSGSKVVGFDYCLMSRKTTLVENEQKARRFFQKYQMLSE